MEVLEHKQAVVRPVLDYHAIYPERIYGGELSATVNLTSLQRDTNDYLNVAGFDRIRGLSGDSSRLTTELEWKRQFVLPGGLLVTPLLAARADGYQLNLQNPAYLVPAYTGFNDNSTAIRTMLTAGLEARYPVIIDAPSSTHMLEPIAQVFARPDQPSPGSLPNDDAQSFVFDATNLFERDKFAGFDRVEGGTRANIGLRYTGTFDSGYRVHGVFGQSYQLAGKNSFEALDLVNAGQGSGLDKPRSDYVSMLSMQAPNGWSTTRQARFDADSFAIRRTDTTVSYASKRFSGSLSYMQSAAQPAYGLPREGQEITARTRFKVQDYWSVFGNVTYNIADKSYVEQGIGIAYDDECTNLSLGFSKLIDPVTLKTDNWKVGVRLSFRTLGDLALGNGIP
jgi:LPS-assembly protein